MPRVKRILVTGSGGAASYNFIESLRKNPNKEKFYIVGTDSNPYHLKLAKVNKKYIVPPPIHPEYIDYLNDIIKKEKIDFLHPQTDKEVKVISENIQKIKTKTLLPRYRIIKICQDKEWTQRILMENKLSVPETYPVTSWALERILKTNDKAWLRAIKGSGSKASLPVTNIRQAKMWIDYWEERGLKKEDFIVSEFLPGKEYAFQSLWRNGKLIMSQARERLEYLFGYLIPSGQTSSPSVAKTVHNEEVNQLASKAILAINPKATGVFCVDMKTDKRGKVNITEINAGRFFTTSLFFSMAGMNMPYYYVKMGLDEKVEHNLKPFNNIPPDWYWIRGMDIGYKLIKKWET